MWSNLRFAIRTLKQRPGYTIAAVIALALGVAANTAIFSIAEGLVYRPLQLHDMDRLVMVPGGHEDKFETGVTPADFMDIREQSSSFEQLSSYEWWNANLAGEGFPERMQGFKVTSRFFQALGVEPVLGRNFADSDHVAGAPKVVILSEGVWQRKFARDLKILGRIIRINEEPHVIVGIAARVTRVPANAELWAPAVMDEHFRADTTWPSQNLLGRLKPGVSLTSAEAEMRTISKRIASQRPESRAGAGLRVTPLREMISGQLTADYTRLTQLAALLLLMIAASNVANLLFAMVSGRSREIALRLALGASRWAIVKQLLAESLVLGLASVPVALILSMWSLDLNKRAMPAEVEAFLPGWRTIGIDMPALLFGIAVAILGSVISGVLPAWIGSKLDLNSQLREGGRSMAGSGRKNFARTALVVVQVTLSMILISGAALMQRGAEALLKAAPGHDTREVLSSTVVLPDRKYAGVAQQSEFAQQLLEKARAMPGVTTAALAKHVPFSGGWGTAKLEAVTANPAKQLPEAGLEIVSSGYFQMMGVPLRAGRDLADSDGLDSQPVAVVSELAARDFFGGDAVGKRLRLNREGPWITVVGVCGDILQEWILRRPLPTIYRPIRQAASTEISVLMRGTGLSRAPSALAPEWRAAVAQLDPDLPVFDMMSQERVIQNQMVGLGFIVRMIGASGILSLLLAAVGVYSLMSFTVSERVRELGIRMALGARPNEIVGMVVRNGLRMTLIGLVLGTIASLAVSRLFAGLIFGIPNVDPVSLGLGAAVLAVGAFSASYFPARWASKVDPMEALRHD